MSNSQDNLEQNPLAPSQVLPSPPAFQNQVHAVSVKLSPFWTNLPSAWFMTTEAAFASSGITQERTKYGYVLQVLTQDVAATVYDVMKDISTTTPTDPYTRIKEALIDRYTVAESRRIEQLISGVDMGDRTPSEFYRHLASLAGSSEVVSDKLILELWTRRLPQLVRATLKVSSKTELRDILKIADDVYDVYRAEHSSSMFSVNGAQSRSAQDQVNAKFERELSEIKEMISALTFNGQQHRRGRDRSHSRNRSRSRSGDDSKNGICWYHNKYGKAARNCEKPCKFNNNSPN